MNKLNEMNANTFPKYYSVKFPRKDSDNEIPLVAVDKDIRSNIGKPKIIKKQNKDTLLMEVQIPSPPGVLDTFNLQSAK